MKNRLNLCTACLTAIALLTFASCDNNDGDTTKPVINLIEPGEDDILEIGDENGVHLDMELSDDVMLKSYKIEIHPNFNGHTHSSVSAVSVVSKAETVDFSKSWTWDLSGQKNAPIHHHEIMIPANATPGDYHLMVYCSDAAGNVAYLARDIVLDTEGGEHAH